jgi:hypothetical protein
VSPLAAIFTLDGVTTYVHGPGVGKGEGGTGSGDGDGDGVTTGTSACAITAEEPPIVTLPTRGPPALAATVTTITADRVPLALGGTVIHGASVLVDHEQPVSVSTVIETAPPFADTAVFAGVTV